MSRIYVDRIYRIYVLHDVIYVIYGGIYDNLYFTKNIYVHIYVYIYGTCMTYIDIHVPNMSLICVIYVCSVWASSGTKNRETFSGTGRKQVVEVAMSKTW